MAAAQDTWFDDLLQETLSERGFKPIEENPRKYTHNSCPGAVFEFVWTDVSQNFKTGNAIWTVGDVSECVSLAKLQRLDPCRRDAIKIQIAENLFLRCLSSCQRHLFGAAKQGLLALPAELILMILEELPVESLCTLAVLHPNLRYYTDDKILWKRLFKKDFKSAKPKETEHMNWRELYKTEYLAGRVCCSSPAVFPSFRKPIMSEIYLGSSYFNDLDFNREHMRWRAGLLRLFS